MPYANREIIFEEFQPVWSQSTNVTDRQDGRTDDRHAIARPHFALQCIARQTGYSSHSESNYMSSFWRSIDRGQKTKITVYIALARLAWFPKLPKTYEHRKPWKSMFSITPLLFDAPSLRNHLEYRHKPYIARNYNHWATFL